MLLTVIEYYYLWSL